MRLILDCKGFWKVFVVSIQQPAEAQKKGVISSTVLFLIKTTIMERT